MILYFKNMHELQHFSHKINCAYHINTTQLKIFEKQNFYDFQCFFETFVNESSVKTWLAENHTHWVEHIWKRDVPCALGWCPRGGISKDIRAPGAKEEVAYACKGLNRKDPLIIFVLKSESIVFALEYVIKVFAAQKKFRGPNFVIWQSLWK